MYKIMYLPIAAKDLTQIIDYIKNHLQSPEAAKRLLAKFNDEIQSLSTSPYRCRVYRTNKMLKHEYRSLLVDNYIVFYIVLEDTKTIEIHRIIYGRRNIAKILK